MGPTFWTVVLTAVHRRRRSASFLKPTEVSLLGCRTEVWGWR